MVLATECMLRCMMSAALCSSSSSSSSSSSNSSSSEGHVKDQPGLDKFARGMALVAPGLGTLHYSRFPLSLWPTRPYSCDR
jgi:hypothetical protein